MLECGEQARSLDSAVVKRAVKALQSHLKKKSAGAKPQLIDDDQFYLLTVNVFKAPEKTNPRPIRIEIPHSLYLDGSEICLITKDPQKEFKERLQTNPIDGYTRVIGFSKLKQKFSQYKDKRELVSSYDLFVADDRVLPILPNILGKAFFSRKKQPVPVRISNEKYTKKELEKARDSTYMFKSAGSCMTIKIARVSQSSAQVVQNIVSGMEDVVRHLKDGWDTVQSVHLKTSESVALELFSQLPKLDTQ